MAPCNVSQTTDSVSKIDVNAAKPLACPGGTRCECRKGIIN